MKSYITIIILAINFLIFPQAFQKVDSVFQPFGIKVKNFTCPFFCDFDNDNLPDLFLGTSGGSRVEYFKNIGPLTNPKFQEDTNLLSSIYSKGSMGTNHDYPCLYDLDGDNDLDLIIGGYNGLLYYKNNSTESTTSWEKIDSTFQVVNNLIGTDPKPEFADLDNDGDLDLLVGIGESLFGGPTPGITMGFRNTGSKFAPKFVRDDNLTTNIPDIGLNAYPALADLYNDGSYDLLLGRDIASLMYYKNTGTPQAPVWTRDQILFQPVEINTYWKNPTLYDIDGDYDLDLIYGNSNGKLYFYKNIGTNTTPQFQYDPNYLVVIKINESASTVSFADFDKDGDFDLLSGNWLGKFEYFRNDGTKTTPLFKRIDVSFSNLSVSSYACPRFVDLDKDGDFDIVSGALNGSLYYYVYNGTSWVQNTTVFSSINVNGFSAPGFVDIDDDGDLDMMVGAEQTANNRFYLNNGNSTFTLDNSFIANIVFQRSANPAFFDYDADGDYDLLLGCSWGDIDFYKNVGNKNLPVWQKDDSTFANIYIRQSSTPGFADLDGDNKIDLTIGDYDGNFWFYKNCTQYTNVKNESLIINNFALEQNYPNPFNNSTKIIFQIPKNGLVQLKIKNILGENIQTLINSEYESGTYSIDFNADNYASGVYLYELSLNGNKITKKMLLIK